jgi:hypothetical protein
VAAAWLLRAGRLLGGGSLCATHHGLLTDSIIKIYFYELVSVGKPRRFSSLVMETRDENMLQLKIFNKCRRAERGWRRIEKFNAKITFIGNTSVVISKYYEFVYSLAVGLKFENVNPGQRGQSTESRKEKHYSQSPVS